MLTPKERRSLFWKAPGGYVATHCLKCQLGWTRTIADGAITACLLDREPVLSDMTNCNRYEPIEE